MFILHVYTQPSLVEEGRLLQVFMMFHFFSCATRDDIFTCAQKLTYVILIHRTEPTTKTWEKKKKKTKKRICSEVSANSPWNPWSQSWRRKGRLRWEGFAEQWGSDGWRKWWVDVAEVARWSAHSASAERSRAIIYPSVLNCCRRRYHCRLIV